MRAPPAAERAKQTPAAARRPASRHPSEPGLEVVPPDHASERPASRIAQMATRPGPPARPPPSTEAASEREAAHRLARPFAAENRAIDPLRLADRPGGPLRQAVEDPGPGEALTPTMRARVEPIIGADLSGTTVHAGPRARTAAGSIAARAFTHGSRIFLGEGESAHDASLIAHEAVHVAQQAAAGRAVVQRTPAEDFIGGFKNWLGLNLREDALGAALAERLLAGEYGFAGEVFDALAWHNRDDVAYTTTEALTDPQLETIVRDGAGKSLLQRFYGALSGGASNLAEQRVAHRIWSAAPTLKNLRIVPRANVVSFIEGSKQTFVIRSSETPREDETIRPGDTVVDNRGDLPRMQSLWAEDPEGRTFCGFRGEEGGYRVTLRARGTWRLNSSVLLPHRHEIGVDRRVNVVPDRFTAASLRAAPADLMTATAGEVTADTVAWERTVEPERVRERTVQSATSFTFVFDQASIRRRNLRAFARSKGAIDEAFYEAGRRLAAEMLTGQSYLTAGTASDELRDNLAALALEVERQLDRFDHQSGRELEANRGAVADLTGASYDLSGFRMSFPGRSMAQALRARRYEDAGRAWQRLQDLYDRVVLARLRFHERERDQEYAQLEHAIAQQEQMRAIERHNPMRVPAVFHAHESYRQAGEIPEVPLVLFTWKEGGEWHLTDLTNPARRFAPSITAAEGSNLPPHELFERLNNADVLPKGRVYYQLPGRPRRSVETTKPWSASRVLSWIALAGAAVGITLLALGSGGTLAGISAAGWAFLVSGIAAGASGAAHIVESAHHGTITVKSVTLDILQIVSGLASAGAIVAAGRVGAAAQSIRAAEGPARLGTGAARVSAAADALYVPLQTTAAFSDTATIVAFSFDAVRQFQAIDRMPGSEEQRDRARIILFTSLLVQGGLTVMSIRGAQADAAAGRRLDVFTTAEGEAMVRPRPVSPEAPQPASPAESTMGGRAPPGSARPGAVRAGSASLPPRSDPNSPHHLLDMLGRGHDPNLGTANRAGRVGTTWSNHSTVADNITSPQEAYRIYNNALADAAGRECAIYWHPDSGTYVVRIGNEAEVRPPGAMMDYICLVHFHPNPNSATILNLPAYADFTPLILRGSGHAFIEFELPGGGRGRVEYGLDPSQPGAVYIRINNPDFPEPLELRFASRDAYESWRWQSEHGKIYVEPGTPLHDQMLHGSSSSGQTMAGRGSATLGNLSGAQRRGIRALRAELAGMRHGGIYGVSEETVHAYLRIAMDRGSSLDDAIAQVRRWARIDRDLHSLGGKNWNPDDPSGFRGYLDNFGSSIDRALARAEYSISAKMAPPHSPEPPSASMAEVLAHPVRGAGPPTGTSGASAESASGLVEFGETSLGRAVMRARVEAGDIDLPGSNIDASGCNYAAVRYVDSELVTRIRVIRNISHGPHSERRLLDSLEANGIDLSRVRGLYSERSPCADCGAELAQRLPEGTPITWSVYYEGPPGTPDDVQRELRRLARQELRRALRRGSVANPETEVMDYEVMDYDVVDDEVIDF